MLGSNPHHMEASPLSSVKICMSISFYIRRPEIFPVPLRDSSETKVRISKEILPKIWERE
ncbi:hypothetical protein H8959_002911 [Pygathrix nigripes]